MMGRIKIFFLIKDQKRPHLANCSSMILLQVVCCISGVGHSPNTVVSVMGYGVWEGFLLKGETISYFFLSEVPV